MTVRPASAVESLLLSCRAILNGVIAFIIFSIILFIPAGSIRFPNAWLFLGIFIGCYVAILIYFSFSDPRYARTRYRAAESETAQKAAMGLLIAAALTMFLVAGLDFRFHWSHVPAATVAGFSVMMVLALVMLFFVMKQNSYASRVIEVQEHQKLIDTGMYGVVRHPMYLAFAVLFLSAPFVLGSWFALLPAVCIPFVLTMRIRNEEDVLRNGLRGYAEYAHKVRYRLIPFIW
ncbi:MAG TPA: isoprenylcysteine carboxylmethyltransferase family protein [Anaerolineales bacterium]|nr:isoprenylcysteine carboxylmethyltransferase family protein [Anaerolineales bacterium]